MTPANAASPTDPVTASAASSNSCFHCGLPVPEGSHFVAEIEDQPREFCCLGCQSVCKIIYDAGLQGFYQRTPDGQLLAPPPQAPKDLGLYDLDEVQSEYVADLGASRDIHLQVEGMVSIFTYGFQKATEAFSLAGIPYYSLTNYGELITLAVEKGMVKPEDQEILLKWREDPANWTGVS